MKPSKLLLSAGMLIALCMSTGCTKDETASEQRNIKATEGLSILEKARIARVARHIANEEKRKLFQDKYSDQNDETSVKVFFENELVDADDFNLWVQPDFMAVLKKDKKTGIGQSVKLVNESKMYSILVDYASDFDDIDLSSNDFCRQITVKATAHSNVNILKPPVKYEGEQSSLCRISYQDLSANKYITEYTEVFKDGFAVLTRISTVNTRLSEKEILNKAFLKAVSPRLKDSIRHAKEEFFNTESYRQSEI